MTIKKPMLADNKPWNPEIVESNLPLLGFHKLDGIRMLVHQGVGYSRSLKPLPNKQLQEKVRSYASILEGFDGEIIVGDPTDPECYKKSHRSCMKEDLEAEHTFHVFDMWDIDRPYMLRWKRAYDVLRTHNVPFARILDYEILTNMDQLADYAAMTLSKGHEGAIFRRWDTQYKNGRATTKSGDLYKFKSKADTEIVITEVHELMHNGNEGFTNEVGRTQRSTAQDGLIPGDTLGAFTGTGEFPDGTPFTTKVGTFRGFTQEDKKELWNQRKDLIGKYLKISYMPIGSDEAPRHPVGLGIRDERDM